MMKVAIVGGGAAGFFCAIRLKEMMPNADVVIYEQQRKVLAKVEISGGGRCNCTNTFEGVTDLKQVYPRGHKLLKRLFKEFGPEDAYQWFESHGVPLVCQPDHCVFPKAQDSHAIIDCFLKQCRQRGVRIETGHKIVDLNELMQAGTYVVWTTGGMTLGVRNVLTEAGVELTPCYPSLFTLNIKEPSLNALMGLVVVDAIVSIPGTRFRVKDNDLLLTHWGVSGPAILKLSSRAAVHLAECQYRSPLAINWTGVTNTDVIREELDGIIEAEGKKLVTNIAPFGLQSRLWTYLVDRALIPVIRWRELGKTQLNRLVEVLTNDQYRIDGRCHFKDEFVTCGGVPLSAVDPHTLESRTIPHLYFAGEVLDIDGITGGFNFQAAWTTADAVARGIVQAYRTATCDQKAK